MSVAHTGNNSRTERPRKIKIGIQVAHVTRDSDTTFKVKRSKVNFQGRGNIVADACTSLIFINSLIFMTPTVMEARRAGRHRRKGWAAAGPHHPAYSGRGHIVSPRAQLNHNHNHNNHNHELCSAPFTIRSIEQRCITVKVLSLHTQHEDIH